MLDHDSRPRCVQQDARIAEHTRGAAVRRGIDKQSRRPTRSLPVSLALVIGEHDDRIVAESDRCKRSIPDVKDAAVRILRQAEHRAAEPLGKARRSQAATKHKRACGVRMCLGRLWRIGLCLHGLQRDVSRKGHQNRWVSDRVCRGRPDLGPARSSLNSVDSPLIFPGVLSDRPDLMNMMHTTDNAAMIGRSHRVSKKSGTRSGGRDAPWFVSTETLLRTSHPNWWRIGSPTHPLGTLRALRGDAPVRFVLVKTAGLDFRWHKPDDDRLGVVFGSPRWIAERPNRSFTQR